MKLILIFLLALPAFAAETEVARVAREVKERKALLLEFRKKVSHGDKCLARDYPCFSEHVLAILKGHTEDIIEAKQILEPFYIRSVKENFPPCTASCLSTKKAQYLDIFLDYLLTYNSEANQGHRRLPPYPTVAATKIRAYMDLSAYRKILEYVPYLTTILNEIEFKKVFIPYFKNKDVLLERLNLISDGVLFTNSVLCHLHPGDLVYDEIKKKGETGKKIDKDYASWLNEFEKNGRSKCADQSPLDYRGTDSSTRRHYNEIRDRKIAEIKCEKGDFGCLRHHLRGLTIRYAEDVEKVAALMEAFVKKSTPDNCDTTCMSQLQVRSLQTWISYLSTFDRKKLASTMDWNAFPETKFLTLTEDVDFYQSLKKIFTPMLDKFGSLDAKTLKDEGLKSEVLSISKDLSDLASAKMLKDSVICTMEPWKAEYEKYMKPYENGARNKKFEKGFIEFKYELCK